MTDGEHTSAIDTARNLFNGGVEVIDSVVMYAEDKYDDVDLLASMNLKFKGRYTVTPIGGLRYVNFEEDYFGAYHDVDGDEVGTGKIENEFDGLGVRFATAASYGITDELQFTALAGSSILMGMHHYKKRESEIQSGGQVPQTIVTTVVEHDEVATIPELDLRLGLRYTHQLDNGNRVAFEGGYGQTHYFDLVDKTDEVRTRGNGDRDDWAFEGPYLRLAIHLV